jgi:uncharacterized membrane protein YfcA
MQISYLRKSSAWILVVLATALMLGSKNGLGAEEALMIFALCFACELVDSGLGMGYGTILTPTLLLLGFRPHEIVPTILFSELLSGLTARFFHHQARNVDLRPSGADLKPALLLAGGSVAGVAVGVAISVNLSSEWLSLVIGLIILSSGLCVILLSKRVVEFRTWKILGLAGVASFNKALSGGGYGPLVTSGQILTGIRGQAAVGITSFAEAFTCLVAVALFMVQGDYLNLPLLIPMCAGALVSVPFSVFAISKTREHHLKVVIGVVTVLMGGLTIYKALH